MLIKTRVLARQQRVDEIRRNFIKRNAQPVRTREATVYFSIDIEHGVALRHRADFFHVEARGPRAVKQKQRQTAAGDQQEERNFPAVAKKFTALFSARLEPGQEFHS